MIPLTFTSAVVQNERLLPGIHGLRGVAALAVVLYHLVHIGGIATPTVFNFIARDFGYSVHLFFILSAYSLMHSTNNGIDRPTWLADYFVKRFFRIAPLYYLMMFLLVAHSVIKGTQSITMTDVVLGLTFTFGFVAPFGFVWGGWSVGVEMIFYCVFPILLLLIKTRKSALIFLVFSIVVSCALRSALHFYYQRADPNATYDWSYFAFPSNFCFFAMGIFAFRLNESRRKEADALGAWIPLMAISIIGALLFLKPAGLAGYSTRPDIAILGIGLTALCAWQAHRPSIAIANHLFEFLGERSYSIYLVHPVIILLAKDHLQRIRDWSIPTIGNYAYFLCAIAALAAVLVTAEITYRLIEVPGIRFGRRLVKRHHGSAGVSI